MKTSSKPLGAGLDQSLKNLTSIVTKASEGATYAVVNLSLLQPYPHQRRQSFNEETLKELAESIRDHGVQQPAIVRPLGKDRYEIIAGERRWRASQLAGRSTIPVLIKHIPDSEAEAIHRAENAHRDNLTTAELVATLAADYETADKSLDAVAKLWNKSKSWVSKMLSLRDLGEAAQALVDGNFVGDREVLADVQRIERADPKAAAHLVESIKTAPANANIRTLVREAAAEKKSDKPAAAKKAAPAKSEPPRRTWAKSDPLKRKNDAWPVFGVEIIGSSPFRAEFEKNTATHGDAVVAPDMRHKQSMYVWVSFGDGAHLADYPCDQLRVTFVE